MNDKDSIELLVFFKEQIKVLRKLKITSTSTLVFLSERSGHEVSIKKLEKEILEVEEKIAEYSQDASNLLKIKREINTLNCRYGFVFNSLQTEKKDAEEPTSKTTSDKKVSDGSRSKEKREGNAKAKLQTPNVKKIDDVQLRIEDDEAEIVVRKDEEALDASNQQQAEDLVSLLEDKKKMETETNEVKETWSSRVGKPIKESKKKPETVVSDKVVPEEVVPGETGEGVWYNRDGKSFLFIKPGPKVCHVYATHGFCKCGDFTTYEHRQLIGINYNKLFNEKTNSWIYVPIKPKRGDFLRLPLWFKKN
jgi:hypothetical protein